jgi:hypothetical protein
MTYGSAFNWIYSNTKPAEPVKVGMGATELFWSDRHAVTIIAVRYFKSGKRKGQVKEVDVQTDTATRVDGFGMSDQQTYEYTRDPYGIVSTYRVDAKGRYRRLEPAGSTSVQDWDGVWVEVPYGPYRMTPQTLLVGSRREYYDFSF